MLSRARTLKVLGNTKNSQMHISESHGKTDYEELFFFSAQWGKTGQLVLGFRK